MYLFIKKLENILTELFDFYNSEIKLIWSTNK